MMSEIPGWHLNFDSAPFCNGSLHLGHVRNYALGDVRARWLRSRGVDVTHATAFDAFGLPNEMGARGSGISTDRYVARQARRIGRQMDRLGFSYDVPPRDYSRPGAYRWSQWLFLRMWDAGLVYRAERGVSWCPSCAEVISVTQADRSSCWRCNAHATWRRSTEWFVRSSTYFERMGRGLETLDGWSDRARRLARESIVRIRTLDPEGPGDWLLSRVRSWGTPLPMVECAACGIHPVDDATLPVRLKEHGGDGLGTCRGCGTRQPLVARTLDGFFDDAWCFEGAVRDLAPDENPFEAWRDRPPARVHFHAGHDSFAYLFVFRLIAHVLHDLGFSRRTEPIDWFQGHDVVTAGGKKMSKRHRNAPNLDTLLDREGAAVLRLSVLAGANPDKPMAWSDDALVRGRRFARTLQRLRDAARPVTPEPEAGVLQRIDGFFEAYRIASALDVLYSETERALKVGSTRPGRLAALLARWDLVVPPDMPAWNRGPSSVPSPSSYPEPPCPEPFDSTGS